MEIQNWSSEMLSKVEAKLEGVLKRNKGKIPFVSVDGSYNDMAKENIFWWTNGFFAGELWQLYHGVQKEEYRIYAEQIEKMLDRGLEEFRGLHHDVGFMWLHTAVANYRLTGNELSKERGIHAATLLAGRFNIKGEFIRAWNGEKIGWVIIDSMMNIPILYWATETTNDPRFAMIANAHANTVLKYLVRDDGTVGHIASFDPYSGEFQEQLGGQGYGPDSAWSRGQAWAIYGFALAYGYTKEEKYLFAAKKIANYFLIQVVQTDYLPLVDFCAPKEPKKWDMSAGTCAVCGMLEIAKHVNSFEKALYQENAEIMLRAIEKAHANWDSNSDGIIEYCSHSYHQEEETHVSLIYADYFFVEALLRLQNKSFQIW